MARTKSQRDHYERNRTEILRAASERKRTPEYREYAREYHSRPEVQERMRRYSIERNYGIPYTEYECMERKQNGACAICGNVPNVEAPFKPNRHLHVDHDHNTGEVRALLCAQCNRGIGLLKDNSELLRRAANYLDGKS